jgi:hypothetical protein
MKTNRNYVYVVMALVLLIAACAHNAQLTSRQTLASTTKVYFTTVDEYSILLNNTAFPMQGRIALVQQVAPIMDKVQDAMILANKLQAQWDATGTKPADIDKQVATLNALKELALSKITAIKAQYVGGK